MCCGILTFLVDLQRYFNLVLVDIIMFFWEFRVGRPARRYRDYDTQATTICNWSVLTFLDDLDKIVVLLMCGSLKADFSPGCLLFSHIALELNMIFNTVLTNDMISHFLVHHDIHNVIK